VLPQCARVTESVGDDSHLGAEPNEIRGLATPAVLVVALPHRTDEMVIAWMTST
jgi:hypothetical protein